MPYETKELTGALFPNDKRGTNEKAPAWKGDCKINGEMFELAAWPKQTSGGREFLSLSLKPKSVTELSF